VSLPAGRPLVLEKLVDLVFHAVLATSLYFLFAGHNSPGGGFIGGLVAGTAFVLRYLVSREGIRHEVRVPPATVLGTGLLVAGAASTVPWLLGGSVLESAITYLELPVLGRLPLASVLVFDTGVYLIVVGIVLAVLSTLGARPDATLGGTARRVER
jgi:multisubunit Na+/H+ antiporter MnhB subunit